MFPSQSVGTRSTDGRKQARNKPLIVPVVLRSTRWWRSAAHLGLFVAAVVVALGRFGPYSF